MDQSSSSDQMPQTIGRYEVQGALGFGAMGAVYKAFDPRIKRLLAIKTIRLDIPRQSPEYKTFIERFYHEARISGTLSHPNIVTLFDIGEERGIPYLAMEYVEGDTISALIERGTRFPPEKVISIVSQVAAAVDYAHSRGVVHRDIKPSNLILHEGERVKVTDFGIAKMMDTELTQQGQMLGTPSYMSPEQAMGEKVDGRTDIFSLGVCAFEMLSGEQPFPGNNVTAILYKLVHVDPIEPADLELRGLVPHKWHEVFRKVLAKQPDARYQSGADFVRDLEYCLGSWFGAAMGEQEVAPPAALEASADATATLQRPPQSAARALPAAGVPQDTPLPMEPTVDVTLPPARPAAPAPGNERTVALPRPAAGPRPGDEDETLQRPPRPAPPAVEALPALDGRVPATPGPTDTLAPHAPVGATILVPPPQGAPAVGPAVAEATILVPPPAVAAPSPAASAPAAGATILVPPVSAPTAPPQGPTERLPIPGVTQVGAPERTVRVPAAAPVPTERLPHPTPARPAAARPAPVAPVARRRSASSGLLLGGAGLLVLLVAGGIVAWLLQQRAPGPTPAPTPSPPTLPTATPASTPLAEERGTIVVESEPSGATVTINGVTRGTTPLRLERQPIGSYVVEVSRPGYEPFSQLVAVTRDGPLVELRAPLARSTPQQAAAATLVVSSDPPGATVRVDGEALGVTPLSNQRLRPGSRRVELQREGYESHAETVSAVSGRTVRLDVVLQPRPVATPTPAPSVAPPAVDPGRVYANTVGEVDTPARKLTGTVGYPEKAPRLRKGESVSVTITFVVDEQGRPGEARVIESGGKLLDDAVIAAIKAWRYSPAVKQGVNVKVRVDLKQTFRAG